MKITSSFIVAILWITGNLVCLANKTEFWPFTAFDMFTRYKSPEEVSIVFTSIQDLDGTVLLLQKEQHLPVYRFWEARKEQITSRAADSYLKAYFRIRPTLAEAVRQKGALNVAVYASKSESGLSRDQILLEARVGREVLNE